MLFNVFSLFDLNVFELLNIETQNIEFCLGINNIIEAKNIDNKTIIVFDIKLENLLHYHSLGCFTVYLSHLVKMDLQTDEQIKYIDKFNEDNLVILKFFLIKFYF